MKLFLSAVSMVLLSFTIYPNSISFESTEPPEESIFEMVGDIGQQHASKKGLAIPVNKTLELKNETILITESLYDGSSIHLAYMITRSKSKKGAMTNQFLEDIAFTLNGKPLTFNHMSAGGKLLDNGYYAGTITIDFHENIPDSFMLGMSSPGMDSNMVEIPITLKGVAKSFPIRETKKMDTKVITFDNIIFYPTGTEIQVQNFIQEEQKHLPMDLNLKVTDEKGHILQPIRGGSSSEPLENGKILVRSSYLFEPLDPIPESLLIQPYQVDLHTYEPENVRKKWEGKPFTLSQGDVGSLTVIDVQVEKDLHTVTYEISGKQDFQQAATIWLENEDGKLVTGIYPPKQLRKNTFQLTFPATGTISDLYIATSKLLPLKYVKELETSLKFKN
ncbi:DUF4179 domain-containing protein [Paucisalibacillus globulus]|uniref:DUF4179 domain-containing protein n=1 Tax=Paucisalibacillus globulus TaxID=351095 RepID=UPI000BB96238|nr:DUF4179 domain-containing protein [Paucisalibacillus globulus]